MKTKIKFSIISVLLLFALANVSYADVLPGGYDSAKLNFLVKYDNQTIADNFRADIVICSQEGCKSDMADECIQSQCSFSYYRVERVPHEMILQLEINGKKIISGTFSFSEKKSIDEYYYTVNINPEGKMIISDGGGEVEQYKKDLGIVSDDSSSPNANGLGVWLFVISLALTMLIEIVVMVIFLKVWKVKKWKKPVLILILANIISLPLAWLSFLYIMPASIFFAVVIAEAFAVVFEAYFMHWLNKKQLKLKQAFVLSLIMNLASFLIGGAILISISLLAA